MKADFQLESAFYFGLEAGSWEREVVRNVLDYLQKSVQSL